MSIVFYYAPRSSASPVASALYELDVPHERVTFDLKESEHKKPGYLVINPNGKVPTLVVDDTPMFEAVAIMMWLGDRYGVAKGLWPAMDDPKRLQALSWCCWMYVTYSSVLVRLQFASSPAVESKFHNTPVAEHAREQLAGLLQILEARLSRQPYMLGKEYSLVDLVVASGVGYSTWVGVSVDGYPGVQRWLKDFQARPSYMAGIDGKVTNPTAVAHA